MTIRYNTPIEVSEKHYRILVKEFAGVLCHKEKEGKFYIKVWLMQYSKYIKQVLNS